MRSKLFEFISRKNDEQSPKISAIIINPKTGEPDYAKMVEFENMNTPRTFADRLFGRTLTKDYETNNTDEKGNADIQTHRASHTRGGLISDFIKGYEENYNDDFNINNLRGAKKSIANRIGEGLGTITRGLAGGLGDSYIAGVYGLPAAMQRQNLRVGDKIYRQDLANFGIDTSNINGFIDSNAYGNLIRSQQIRDNAEWRKLQNETMQDMRNREFEYRKRQDAIENALRARGIEIQENKANNKVNVSDAEVLSIKDQLKNFDDIFEKVNNPYRFRVFGKTSEKLNTYSPEESNFVSQANLLFNQISRNLGGEKGVLSDQDIERIKAGMPKLEDTLEQKRAKMSAIYSLLEIKLKAKGIPFENPYDIYGKKVTNQDKSNLNIDANTQSKYSEGQTATNPQTGQKMIFRGGQWQIL